jgi:transaldolase/glucose-6-phosphate isomerase
VSALQHASQPCITLRLPDKNALAGEFFRWEFAAVLAAHLLKVNPFDAPNVAESKANTAQLLDYYSQYGSLPEPAPALTEDNVRLYADEKLLRQLSELSIEQEYSSTDLTGMLAAQINSTRAGDYFALLDYLPQTPEVSEMLENIRRRLRHTTRRAVTLGVGFFILTTEGQPDLGIPNMPYSFGTLYAAQALGDLEVLQKYRRRVLRLHFTDDLIAGMQKIVDAIDAVGERRR